MTMLDESIWIRDVDDISVRLLAQRSREGEVTGTSDPHDRRNVLLRRCDLEQLMTPRGGPPDLHRVDSVAELAARQG